MVLQNRHRKHLFVVTFVLPAACRARWISNLSWLQNIFLQILQRPACDFHLFLPRVFLLEISDCDCCCTWVKFTEFEICLSIPKLNRALTSGCMREKFELWSFVPSLLSKNMAKKCPPGQLHVFFIRKSFVRKEASKTQKP